MSTVKTCDRRKLDETKNYFLEDIKEKNSMTKKHKKVQKFIWI